MTSQIRLVLALLATLALAACSPPANRGDTRAFEPQAAAQALVDRVESLGIDGLPDDAQMRALAPLLAPELRADFEAARAWQRGEIERMQREGSEDKPPFVEGDLFSSLFEGADSSRVLSLTGNDARSVAVVERGYGSGGDRVVWRDRVVLRRSGDRWLLVDIEYGGDWAFQAGTRSLAQTLKARD
ncbi:MAG: hypothetical protein IPK27_23330 [Rhodanobacteraceae bacterium]|nr:hypothetical protein [Rhodanobacteraceae bacterium]